MPRVDDHSPRARECERAASWRNPRDRDPKRWSRTAWRPYLYAATHAPSLLDLERIAGHRTPSPKARRPRIDGGIFLIAEATTTTLSANLVLWNVVTIAEQPRLRSGIESVLN
jgi:hypothetical protein